MEGFCHFLGRRNRIVTRSSAELVTFYIPSKAWTFYSIPKGNELVLLLNVLKSIFEAVSFVDEVF